MLQLHIPVQTRGRKQSEAGNSKHHGSLRRCTCSIVLIFAEILNDVKCVFMFICYREQQLSDIEKQNSIVISKQSIGSKCKLVGLCAGWAELFYELTDFL